MEYMNSNNMSQSLNENAMLQLSNENTTTSESSLPMELDDESSSASTVDTTDQESALFPIPAMDVFTGVATHCMPTLTLGRGSRRDFSGQISRYLPRKCPENFDDYLVLLSFANIDP